MNEQLPYSFNPYCKGLDGQVLRWAWDEGLFEDPAELERCRTQQINSFSGFLYPEFEEQKLELVMKFFLTLFLLDDLMDIDFSDEKLNFLEKLATEDHVFFPKRDRLSRLGNQVVTLYAQVGREIITPSSQYEWQLIWDLYTSGMHWEFKNKVTGKIPDLGIYRTLRPFTSGVRLAILISRSDSFDDSCRSVVLENRIARFISLSNDLDSYRKEMEVEDYHNEVLLLQLTTEKDVVPKIREELQSLYQRILIITQRLIEDSEACMPWVNSLLNLVAGCVAWSRKTYRYQANINGKSGFNH